MKSNRVAHIEHKSIPFEVKATSGTPDDPGSGDFEGVGGCFHNIDSTYDIVASGAFTENIPKFLSDGFIGGMNHNWDSPIGHPIEAKETPEGLWFRAVLDDTPDAQAVRAKMRVNPVSGRATVKKLSIGYKTLASERLNDAEAVRSYWRSVGYTPRADDEVRLKSAYTARRDPSTGKEVTPKVRLLKSLSLYEVSPVSVPANDRASILGTKFMSSSYGMGGGSSGSDPDNLLGDTDEILAWGAMSRLHDLLCMALYGILGNDMVPIADRLMLAGQAVDQFKASLIDVLTYFLSADAADDMAEPAGMESMSAVLADMSRQFKTRFGLPTPPDDDIAGKLSAASAPGFSDQSRMVVSAVEGFVERAEARLDARVKDGRELSAANRRALTEVHQGLMGHAEAIHGMLARTTKPEKSVDADAAHKADDVVPPVIETPENATTTIADGKANPPAGDTTESPAAQAAPAEAKADEVPAPAVEAVPAPAEAKNSRVDPDLVKGLFAEYVNREATRWADSLSSDTTTK